MDLLDRYLDVGFSYPDVGITSAELLDRKPVDPEGYRRLYRRTCLGPVPLNAAAEVVLTWRMHKWVGLRPTTSAPRATPGVTVVSRLGPLPAPCRVVWAVEEERRVGFAYGTLSGHPESGEEAFLLEAAEDGQVWFTICAYTRPGRWFTRLAGPLAGLFQEAFARLYAIAVRSGARKAHTA